MRLAIDIDGVLRDTFLKIEQLYQKYFIDELEIVDDEFVYEIKTPYDTDDYQNHFMFKNDEEYISFLYQEFAMQIFGHAPSSEMSTFHILNETYNKYKDRVDFVLISKQVGKTKPATLFFFSKFGCEIDKVVFYNNLNKDKIWDEFDVLLTANPDLLKEDKNKTTIKFETTYNLTNNNELVITSIKELEDKIENLLK
jgi:FMN phosphatase YigB (HAD superfamily)